MVSEEGSPYTSGAFLKSRYLIPFNEVPQKRYRAGQGKNGD